MDISWETTIFLSYLKTAACTIIYISNILMQCNCVMRRLVQTPKRSCGWLVDSGDVSQTDPSLTITRWLMAWRVTSNIHLGPVKGNHFHSVLDTWNKSSTTFIIKWNVSKHIRFMYSFVPRSFKSIALLNWISIGRFNWHLTRNIGAKSYINRRGKLLNVK